MSFSSKICNPILREKERKNMVDFQIVSRGIRNKKVLSAMRSIPRECFVPDSHVSQAYDDKPLPIGYHQTISQPFMVAWMSLLLEIRKGDRIFEIGTGSGYQSAVLIFLGAKLFSVEFFESLHKIAIQNLELWNPGCTRTNRFVSGNATQVLKPELQFDKMISCAALPDLPGVESSYFHSLVPGGFFIFPMGKKKQFLITARRNWNDWSFESKCEVKFVPLL
ncbi:protein-L-isoaspartate O-methyltransferase family protein [Leptospira borgpetersenii]|uniref:Protein-L-isoaspartate O-methyltransferase n=2 Tax=Leptospira borgpetersenii serovar Hardjo-bovis TaxID=338217 RepID=Q04PS1_LEPBJ|nr:protein-L-isoaspartate O-methyltransferase [Leptospira borgpetersenii]ABJ77099.1 L-isoaspartate protein carboxylmethyltransferase [Leptospira borgpetersenii serovar Hardjo-bovis str. JB197]ABJ78002.1 L-isoaspartate protein carboxylmethyltransferase [Leptospira borgpetersenii serovar Hardjo-bovis str. L550]AMX57239.1 protein-L-isoaspartate O-methyltransferase [Leptospira borgpetersenii serovar Hardjo]AMX60470.1 protein-L-isoaspartate O-methyltransferase [Leptospira borgpetersenii serovar Hard